MRRCDSLKLKSNQRRQEYPDHWPLSCVEMPPDLLLISKQSGEVLRYSCRILFKKAFLKIMTLWELSLS